MKDMNRDMNTGEIYCEECGDPVGDFESDCGAQLCRNCFDMYEENSVASYDE